MKIVVDKDIPFAEEYFSVLGEVEKIDGRNISAREIKSADVLIVRTVTRINEQLLSGSNVKFVASATSGIDHIDMEYLKSRDIGFASAPGSNARSVAEYVLSSLFVLMDMYGFDISGKTAGIIGNGHVGSRVVNFLDIIGIEHVVYDPPLEEKNPGFKSCDLKQVAAADIISLHVPLVETGNHPTRHMLDGKLLESLKPDVTLINTSRGDVIDEQALLAFMSNNKQARAVLDVWSGEPDINLRLLSNVTIATPHIAGYSMDGKLKATQTVFKHACKYFNVDFREDGLNTFFDADISEISVSGSLNDIEAIQMAVLSSYDVRTDSSALRQLLDIDKSQRRPYFDELRSNYRSRREFNMLGINLSHGSKGLSDKFRRLGFRVVTGEGHGR